MAIDRVVDSALLDANLTTIADAIREKGETTAELAFPTGFVEAIANLETGGALPAEIVSISAGTYTPTEDKTSNVTIAHNLGVVPDVVAVVVCDDISGGEYLKGMFSQISVTKDSADTTDAVETVGMYINSSGGQNSIRSSLLTITASTFEAMAGYINMLKSGYTYAWVAATLASYN